MKKTRLVLAAILLLGTASAITQQEIEGAKALIASSAACGSLSDSRLELIGEYYMELMHPGAAHELMHRMMGLSEGSEAEKQFHVLLARRIYCNENTGMMGYGMMGRQSAGSAAGVFYLGLAVAVIALAYFFVKKRKN